MGDELYELNSTRTATVSASSVEDKYVIHGWKLLSRMLEEVAGHMVHPMMLVPSGNSGNRDTISECQHEGITRRSRDSSGGRLNGAYTWVCSRGTP